MIAQLVFSVVHQNLFGAVEMEVDVAAHGAAFITYIFKYMNCAKFHVWTWRNFAPPQIDVRTSTFSHATIFPKPWSTVKLLLAHVIPVG